MTTFMPMMSTLSDATISLSVDTLTTVLVGAGAILLSMNFSNGSLQKDRHEDLHAISKYVFILGWAIIIYGLNFNFWATIGAILILSASFIFTLSRPLFIIGWLLIGLGVSGATLQNINVNSLKFVIAFAAVIGMLISVLVVLPFERIDKVTDTIGMPLMTASWVALASAAALTR